MGELCAMTGAAFFGSICALVLGYLLGTRHAIRVQRFLAEAAEEEPHDE